MWLGFIPLLYSDYFYKQSSFIIMLDLISYFVALKLSDSMFRPLNPTANTLQFHQLNKCVPLSYTGAVCHSLPHPETDTTTKCRSSPIVIALTYFHCSPQGFASEPQFLYITSYSAKLSTLLNRAVLFLPALRSTLCNSNSIWFPTTPIQTSFMLPFHHSFAPHVNIF